MRVLALLLCLPALALGAFEECQDLENVQFPSTNQTGYNSYIYEVGPDGQSCVSALQTCATEFPNNNLLRGRSWFITDNKDPTGLSYNVRGLQLANVQCPIGTSLHLFPQFLQTEGTGGAGITECEDADYVRVTNEVLTAEENTFCGNDEDRRQTFLYNSGLGRVSISPNVAVEFCTNTNADIGLPEGVSMASLLRNNPVEAATGFVVRATCLDPRQGYQPGCADYDFFRAWDPEWLEIQQAPYGKPRTADFPHKRSAEEIGSPMDAIQRQQHMDERLTARRMKRFGQLVVYDFDEDGTVVYRNGIFTIDFGNGTVITPNFRFRCALAKSDFFGSLKFFVDAPFTFRGPGSLEIDGNKKLPLLCHTVNTSDPEQLQEVLVPNAEAMAIVNRIYEYIFNCWIRPYPVVHRDLNSPMLPLPEAKRVAEVMQKMRLMIAMLSKNPNSNNPPPPPFQQIRGVDGLGFLKESFWPLFMNGDQRRDTCYRGTLIRAAPLYNEQTEERIRSFCSLFAVACNPIIRAACDEFERISS